MPSVERRGWRRVSLGGGYVRDVVVAPVLVLGANTNGTHKGRGD